MRRRAIFLSYRRADTADVVGRVNDALVVAFGENEVFRDVDHIPMGADFAAHIGETLNRCRVCLVFIGPDWLDARDEQGQRRLDDHRDLVRVEIETALQTPKLLVVPVLVNGARMPSREALPVTMRDLVSLNAASMRRDPDFRTDMARLVEALRRHLRTGKLDLSALGGAAAKAAGLSAAVAMSWGVLAGAVGVATVVPQVREPIVAAGVGLFESAQRPEASSATSMPTSEADQQNATMAQVDQTGAQQVAEPTPTSPSQTQGPVSPPSMSSPAGRGDAAAALRELDRVHANGWIVGYDTQLNFSYPDLEAAAQLDPRAQYVLAAWSWDRDDLELHATYLVRSARGNLALAQGRVCMLWRFDPTNPSSALGGQGLTDQEVSQFCELSANAGNLLALLRLSSLYAVGRFFPQDMQESCRYLRRAASISSFPAAPNFILTAQERWRTQSQDPYTCGPYR